MQWHNSYWFGLAATVLIVAGIWYACGYSFCPSDQQLLPEEYLARAGLTQEIILDIPQGDDAPVILSGEQSNDGALMTKQLEVLFPNTVPALVRNTYYKYFRANGWAITVDDEASYVIEGEKKNPLRRLRVTPVQQGNDIHTTVLETSFIEK